MLGCSTACNLKPSSPITSKQDRRKGILQDSRDQQQWCNLKLKAMATGWVNYGQLSPSQDPLILRTRPLPSMTCQTAHQMTRSRTTYANALALLHVWRSRCSSLVMYVWNYVKQLKVRSLSLTFINMVWTFKMHSFHLMWRSFCGPPVPWRVEFPWPGLLEWCNTAWSFTIVLTTVDDAPMSTLWHWNILVWAWPCATKTGKVSSASANFCSTLPLKSM